jgi:hypothetical protein
VRLFRFSAVACLILAMTTASWACGGICTLRDVFNGLTPGENHHLVFGTYNPAWQIKRYEISVVNPACGVKAVARLERSASFHTWAADVEGPQGAKCKLRAELQVSGISKTYTEIISVGFR